MDSEAGKGFYDLEIHPIFRHVGTMDGMDGGTSDDAIVATGKIPLVGYMGVSKNRATQNGWFIMDNPIKWMIWGYPYFRKHPYIYIFELRSLSLSLSVKIYSIGSTRLVYLPI